MPTKFFFRTFAATLLLALSTVVVSAQVQQASGKITLKQADGTVVPVKDAAVDFFRTDISQKFSTKTNAKGDYIHAGIPFVGIYTIAISAPGTRPNYQAGIKISQRPVNDFLLEPGDGARLTPEQIKTLMAAGPSKGVAPAGASEADKKKAADAAKEVAAENARITEANAKAADLNTKLPDIIKAANAAFDAKNYDQAITLYDQGIQLDPTQSAFYRNKALALRTRGVANYNTASKAKDAAGKDAARADFKASVEAAESAVSAGSVQSKAAGSQSSAPADSAADKLSMLSIRAESYKLALQTLTPVDASAAAKAFQEYTAAETDPVKKMQARVNLADALFQGSKVDEAITEAKNILADNPDNVDANRIIGIALFSKGDKASFQEAANYLQHYVDKAPDTDPLKGSAKESLEYLKTAENVKPQKVPAAPARTGKGGRRP